MAYDKEYNERVTQYGRRNRGDVVVNLTDVNLALVRLGKKDEQINRLAQALTRADTSVFPSDIFVKDKNGEIQVNLSAPFRGLLEEQLNAVPGARELFLELQKDTTLRGKETIYTRDFREARRRTGRKNADATRKYLTQYVDHGFGLAADGKMAHLESPITRESYKEIEGFLQGMVDKIFSASGLKKYKPKVYLTKNQSVNAFVLTQDAGTTVHNYTESATDKHPLELPVFIHEGLLRKLKTEDEVAGVLAHEFAHLLQPDYLSSKDESLQKRLEYDADAQAMRLADAAGFNPRGLIEVFKNFPKDGNALKIIFGSTHPDSAQRIIELEKLFNRGEIPLPNAAKKMKAYSETMLQALEQTKDNFGLELSTLNVVDLEKEGNLEANLKKVERLADYLKYGWEIATVANSRLDSKFKNYELNTGEFGQRDLLLKQLNTIQALLLKSKQTDSEIHLNVPGINSYGLQEIDLEVDQKMDFTTQDKVGDLKVSLDQQTGSQNKIDKIKEDYDIDNEQLDYSLNDWVSEYPPEGIALFWKHVQDRIHGKVLNRGYKLFIIRNWLQREARPNYYDKEDFTITSSEEVVEKTITSVDLKDRNVLDNIPLALRAHRKKSGEGLKVETIYGEQKKTKITNVYGFFLERAEIGQDIWRPVDNRMPEAIKDLAVTSQEQVSIAYQKFLKESGFGNVSKDVASYITLCLMGNSLTSSLTNLSKNLLAFTPNPGIKFFDEVYKTLNLQNFDNLNKDIRGFEQKANFIRDQIAYFIVFLFAPQDEAEEKIRHKYLKQIQLDPTALSYQTEVDEDDIPANLNINKKYLNTDYNSQKKHLKMKPSEARILSVQEVVFSELGRSADGFIFDNRLEEMPMWISDADLILPNNSLAEYINQGSLNQLERAKDKMTGRTKIFEDVEKKASRCINTLMGLIEKIKKEDLIDLDQIKIFQNSLELMVAGSSSGISNYREAEKLQFISNFVKRYADIFSEELVRGGVKSKTINLSVERYLWQFLGTQFSYQDILQENVEIQALDQKKEGTPIDDDLTGVPRKTGKTLAWYLYRRKDFPINERFDLLRLAQTDVLNYLNELAKQDQNAAALHKLLLKISHGKREIPQQFLILATGHLSEFGKFIRSSSYDDGSSVVDAQDVISCLRLAEKIYGGDWKPLEQYRRFDEQLGVWEWTKNNPLIKDAVTERHGKNTKKIPLVEYIQTAINNSRLTKLYEMDEHFISGPRFSWPLFLNDLWAGDSSFIDEIEDKFYTNDNSEESNKEKKKKLEALHLFKKRLIEIINNPNNLKEIFGMQPGFFKEFILNKKMEVLGVEKLEDIEGYMEYFTGYTHEGSKRNQLPGIIENIRNEARKKRKIELFIQAVEEIIEPEERRGEIIKQIKQIEFEGSDDLSDRNITVYDRSGNAKLNIEESDLISKKMRELLVRDELHALSGEGISEADLCLYSDHVVENDKSKLEIGPVYRIRWLAKPLMEWHTQALEKATSPQEAKTLFGRIEKNLPEKHPLRDLFVKNQLAMEVWQILNKTLTNPTENGFGLIKKEIDIEKALKSFPLNAEHSFLKSYSIFEVSGLIENADKLPPEAIESIIEAIENVVNEQISPDQHAAMRRLLFNLEQKTKFESLKQERKSNPQVFDKYLERVLLYYPGPSLERDDILEQSAMDLAQTPEQIRQVWSLRYQEQTRWANEDESFAQKKGFEAAERARLGIMNMDTLDRSQYLLWMLGRETPLSELFTSQETGISLEDRKNTLWKMTKTERRSMLYELLMGDKGILQTAKFKRYEDSLSDEELNIIKAHELNSYGRKEVKPEDMVGLPPRWDRPSDMIRHVVDSIFEQTFGDQALDPNLDKENPTNKRGRELMQTVFHELFLQQEDSAQRTELMINIVEAVGKNKYEGKNLTPGELMKLLLQQVGVVGVKVGQVLSEQPGLLPESMQRELATLKDEAETFSKRGVLTYLESAGWVDGDNPKILSVEECIGSASIKQVMKGKTKDGESVAIKVMRPNILKLYDKQRKLLKGVLGKLKEKGFPVPGYLDDEVHNSITEELSFNHEADNQRAMRKSLMNRNAAIPIEVGGVVQEISLSVSAPLSVSEVRYPTDENAEDIGLMVEEFVRGLSLKNLQEYQVALLENDQSRIEKMRKKVGELYGQPRIEKVEKQIVGMNIDNLQAQLAIDLLRQITNDGVFHADLHGGNFYLDFNPSVKDGVFSEMRGVFIDLGSVGYSKSEAMPQYQKEIAGDNFNSSSDFRDFITALFSIDIMPEGSKKKISEMVGRYAGLDWSDEKVNDILFKSVETETRVKSLFNAILEQKGDRKLNPQFRALLKTLATAAGHFDKLKSALLGENPESLGISPEEMASLLNFDAIAAA